MNFRKSLVLSTALTAAGVLAAQAAIAAEKPTLRISGYQETFMGLADVDNGTASSGTPTYAGGVIDGAFNILQYGEIRFTATGTTDSGMKWGVYFENAMDESDDGSATPKLSTDEANLFLEGTWGKLEIGGQDGAADRMRITGTDVDLLGSNILGAFARTRAVSGLRGTDVDNILDTSDDSKLTYYTPRVSGFQAGISYVPSIGTSGSVASGDKEGGIEAAIGYRGKFGATSFELTGAYAQTGEDSVGNTIEGFLLGGKVGFGAFSVAAGFSLNDNWREEDTEQKAWSVGLNYNGGKWEVSLLHVESELEFGSGSSFAGSADDEYTQTALQGAYNLGGGLTAAAGVYFFELESANGTGSNINGVPSRGPADGTAFITKLNARF